METAGDHRKIQLMSLSEQIVQKQKELSDIQKTINGVNKPLSQLVQELDEKMGVANKDFSKKVASIAVSKKEKESELSEVSMRLNSAKNKLSETIASLSEQKNNLFLQSDILHKTKEDILVFKKEIKNLQGFMEGICLEKEKTEKDLEEKRAELKDVSDGIHQKKNELLKYQKDCGIIEESIQRITRTKQILVEDILSQTSKKLFERHKHYLGMNKALDEEIANKKKK